MLSDRGIARTSRPRALVLAGPEPMIQIRGIERWFPGARVHACDLIAENALRAQQAGAERVWVGDVELALGEYPEGTFDLIDLDYCGTLTGDVRRTCAKAATKLKPKTGVLVTCFMYARDGADDHARWARADAPELMDTLRRHSDLKNPDALAGRLDSLAKTVWEAWQCWPRLVRWYSGEGQAPMCVVAFEDRQAIADRSKPTYPGTWTRTSFRRVRL